MQHRRLSGAPRIPRGGNARGVAARASHAPRSRLASVRVVAGETRSANPTKWATGRGDDASSSVDESSAAATPQLGPASSISDMVRVDKQRVVGWRGV